MENLKIFENSEFGSVRALELDGEPWFIGRDVAGALGYGDGNDNSKALTNALKDHVDDEDKKLLPYEELKGCQNGDLKNISHYGATVINESGLYSLVMGSKLPTAKAFKRWVTHDVLPAIRRTGMYAVDDLLDDPDLAIKAFTALKEERQKRLDAEARIEADKPKVLFADAVSASSTSILIGDLAKLLKQNGYNTGQKRLFEWLRQNGYLIKSGQSQNMPTQKAMEMGLFEVKETTINNPDGSIRVTRTTKVTGKGQVYFTNLLIGKQEVSA